MPTWFRNVIIGLLCVAFVASRFWRFADACLWFDEIFSIHAATLPWSETVPFIAKDLIHPPLFYIVLKLWINLGGESLPWVRAFPAIFACLSLIPIFGVARVTERNTATRILMLVFFCANGAILKYSQEVRMYSMLMCLSLFSIWMFVRYFNKGKSYLPLLIINILMVWTHYFGWFVVVAEVAAILYFQRIKWRRTLIMFAIVVASFVPWIVTLLRATGTGEGVSQNIGWMQRPGLRPLLTFIFNLVEPFYYQASSVEPISIYRVTLPIIVILLVAGVVYLIELKTKDSDEKQTVQMLSFLVGIPLFIAFVVSWVSPLSIWGSRHLIIVFVPAMLLFATAVSSIRPNWLRIGSMTLIVLFSCAGFVSEWMSPKPEMPWCNWEKLVADVPANEPTTVYALEDLTAYHLWFATRNRAVKPSIFKLEGLADVPEDKAYFLPRGFDEVKKVSINEIPAGKAWVFYRQAPPDGKGDPTDVLLEKGARSKTVRSIGLYHSATIEK